MMDIKDAKSWYFVGNAYLSNFFVGYKGIEELDISFPDKNKSENIRVTLHSKEDIINFCKHNSVNYTHPHSVIYKKRYEWDNVISDKIGENTYFTNKEYNLFLQIFHLFVTSYGLLSFYPLNSLII